MSDRLVSQRTEAYHMATDWRIINLIVRDRLRVALHIGTSFRGEKWGGFHEVMDGL